MGKRGRIRAASRQGVGWEGVGRGQKLDEATHTKILSPFPQPLLSLFRFTPAKCKCLRSSIGGQVAYGVMTMIFICLLWLIRFPFNSTVPCLMG